VSTVSGVVIIEQAQRLQTGLRLRDRNPTMTSRKLKGSCNSGRKLV